MIPDLVRDSGESNEKARYYWGKLVIIQIKCQI